MAEGWLRYLAGDCFHAESAGSEPRPLNPMAIAVMNEVGIDISGQQSKSVVSLLGQFYPFVVTVCQRAQAGCPIFPGVCTREDWPVKDPSLAMGSEEEKIAVFRSVRDDIGDRIRNFVAVHSC
jgi:arsenate reductase